MPNPYEPKTAAQILAAKGNTMTTPIEALQKIAEHLSSDWPDRCQANVRLARAALLQMLYGAPAPAAPPPPAYAEFVTPIWDELAEIGASARGSAASSGWPAWPEAWQSALNDTNGWLRYAPMRSVRVGDEGDTVVITVKGDTHAAQWLCARLAGLITHEPTTHDDDLG